MGRYDTSKATDTHQKLMNSAYKNDVMAYDFLDKLPLAERYAVVLGNLNYQVCNGGWEQWVYNGYCVAYPHVLEALTALGTENALAVRKQVESMSSFLRDDVVDGTSTEQGCFGTYIDDEFLQETDTCQWCDGSGEEVQDYDEDGTEIFDTCTECGGAGEVEYENSPDYPSSSAYWAREDELLAEIEVFLTEMVKGEYCEL